MKKTENNQLNTTVKKKGEYENIFGGGGVSQATSYNKLLRLKF